MVLFIVHSSSDFSVSPSPLGTDWDLGLTGLGLGLGDLGLGTGFDNSDDIEDISFILLYYPIMQCYLVGMMIVTAK